MENFTSNPSENRGPMLTAVMWTLFSVATAFLALRLYARIKYAKLWYDDALIVLGWLGFLGLTIMNQLSVNLGFGKHALDIDIRNLDIMTVFGASGLSCSTVAIAASKLSFAVTLIPLSSGWTRYYVYFAIATTALVAIPTGVTPWVQCTPLVKTFVDFWPGECINKEPSIKYGEFASVWSALIDFSLALLPWKLIWGLQMRMAERIGVIIAMSLGLLSGATSIVRMTYLKQLIYKDISYDAPEQNIWTGVEIAASMIASCIPVLRTFLKRKIASTRSFLRTGRLGRSKDSSGQRSDAKRSLAQETIRLSSKVAQRKPSHPRSRTYSELDDDFDLEGAYPDSEPDPVPAPVP